MSNLYKLNDYFFNAYICIVWILIILSLSGLYSKSIYYLGSITYYIRFYILLLLLLKFNPFYNPSSYIKFTELDRKLIFSACLIILTTDTTIIDNIGFFFGLTKYTDKINNIVNGNK